MQIAFNFDKLKKRILEKYGTLSNFAEAAGIKTGTLRNRFKKGKWTPDEIQRISSPELLDIPGDQIYIYFFEPKF